MKTITKFLIISIQLVFLATPTQGYCADNSRQKKTRSVLNGALPPKWIIISDIDIHGENCLLTRREYRYYEPLGYELLFCNEPNISSDSIAKKYSFKHHGNKDWEIYGSAGSTNGTQEIISGYRLVEATSTCPFTDPQFGNHPAGFCYEAFIHKDKENYFISSKGTSNMRNFPQYQLITRHFIANLAKIPLNKIPKPEPLKNIQPYIPMEK